MPSAVSWSDTTVDSSASPTEPVQIMAFTLRGGVLGAAYVSSDIPHIMHIMEAQPEQPDLPTVEHLVMEERPRLIILPGRGAPQLVELVQDLLHRAAADLPASKILLGLPYEFKPSSLPPFDRVIARDNLPSVSAAAAIIVALKRDSTVSTLPSRLEWFSMSSHMAVSHDSLLALLVINKESHPNMHFDAKGGLSLLSIMDRCKSSAGKRLLRQWVTRPLKSRAQIDARLDDIGWVVEHFASRGVLEEVQQCLRGLPRIDAVLNAVVGDPTYQSFRGLQKFLKAVSNVASIIPDTPTPPACLAGFDTQLVAQLSATITGIVDFVQSRAQGRIVVRPKVHPDLDRLRERYHGLPDFLSGVVSRIADRVSSPAISTLNVVYFPQLGFLVTIPLRGGSAASDIREPGFDLQFATERVAYFKEEATRALDSEIGDVYADMVDREIEIARVLSEQIAPHRQVLVGYGQRLAELDCLLSLAHLAIEARLTRPVITDGADLDIRGGWHLLQERVCDNVVPNDCSLEGERIVILTGPNASGKSIFMKQVALIVLMAHMGSFVPAASARIGIVDRLFTRIRTRESITSDSSAFQTDLLQMREALAGCTDRSILFIDEFGKGTIPADGIAIFAAVAEHLAARPACPRTIAITHFHEIYQLGLLAPDLPIKWCAMDVLEGDAVTFLYKVVAGKASSSLGMHCARLARLPDDLIARAAELERLFAAKVPPLSIRYAAIDPQLEQLALDLVRHAVVWSKEPSTAAQEDLGTLRQLAHRLLDKF